MNGAESCPVCHKSLPPALEANFCPHCGVRFNADAPEPPDEIKSQQPSVGETAEELEPEPEGIPWESQLDESLLNRLAKTWSESLFNTVHFFRNLPVGKGILRPLLYGMLFKIIGAIFTAYWQPNAVQELERSLGDMPPALQDLFRMILENSIVTSPTTQLFLAPWVGLFSLFFLTFIFHIAMLVTGAAKRGFETTFRVVAYSEGTAIFYAIPYVGGLVVNIYWLVLIILGCREAHGGTTGAVVAGVFLPLIFCACTLALFIIGIISTLAPLGN